MFSNIARNVNKRIPQLKKNFISISKRQDKFNFLNNSSNKPPPPSSSSTSSTTTSYIPPPPSVTTIPKSIPKTKKYYFLLFLKLSTIFSIFVANIYLDSLLELILASDSSYEFLNNEVSLNAFKGTLLLYKQDKFYDYLVDIIVKTGSTDFSLNYFVQNFNFFGDRFINFKQDIITFGLMETYLKNDHVKILKYRVNSKSDNHIEIKKIIKSTYSELYLQDKKTVNRENMQNFLLFAFNNKPIYTQFRKEKYPNFNSEKKSFLSAFLMSFFILDDVQVVDSYVFSNAFAYFSYLLDFTEGNYITKFNSNFLIDNYETINYISHCLTYFFVDEAECKKEIKKIERFIRKYYDFVLEYSQNFTNNPYKNEKTNLNKTFNDINTNNDKDK